MSIVIGLLFVPLVLNYLDEERYGIWITLSSIVGWFSFFDIGLGNGLRNKFGEALAKNQHDLAKQYVSTTYAIIISIFITLLIIFYTVNPLLNWDNILNTENVPSKELSVLALIVFTFFFLRFIFKLVGVILLADQRPAVNNMFGPAGNLIALIIIYILMKTTEGSLVMLGLVISAAPVAVLAVATVVLFNGKYKPYRPSVKTVNFRYSRDLMGLGFKFFIIQIAALILMTSNNIILTQFFSPEEVTKYNISYKYFSLAFMVYSIIVTPYWSAITNAYFKGETEWIRRSVKSLRLVLIFVAAAIVLQLSFANPVYRFWVGSEISIPMLLSISNAVYFSIMAFNLIYVNFINGVGKLNIQLIHSLILIFANIPLAIFLIRYTNLGPSSVVWANIGIQSLALIWAPYQYNLLIQNKAKGPWNR